MIFPRLKKPEQAIFIFGDLALGFDLKTMPLLNLKVKLVTW